MIDAASATFNVKNLGSNLDFASKIKHIAGSVKSGNVSFGITVTNTASIQGWIQVDSDNLMKDNTGVDSTLSTAITYDVTLYPVSKVKWQLTEVSGDAVSVAVGVVALVVLAAAAAFARPEVGLVEGLLAIGAAAAA